MKILLAERNVQDVMGIRWYIQTYLAGSHQIEYVTNATDAIIKLHTFEPEILLINLDLLPDKRVPSIYQPLQQANCHIFTFSSDTLFKTAKKAIDIHAKAIWMKPLDLEQFLFKITNLPPIKENKEKNQSFYYNLFQEDTESDIVFTLIEPENKNELQAIFKWLNESISFQHLEIYPLSQTIVCLLPDEDYEKDARMIAKNCPYIVNVCIVDEKLSVQSSYQQAKRRLQQRFYEGYGHVLHTSKMVLYSPLDPILSPTDQTTILAILESSDLEQFQQFLEPLRINFYDQEDVRVHLTSILAQIRRFMISQPLLHQSSIETQYFHLYRSIVEHPILFSILDDLIKFTSILMQHVQEAKAHHQKGYVSLALNYIGKHYARRDLSLQEVAKFIGMNANYLSTLFTQETGHPYTQTVLHIRITKSKELLEQTSKTILEIAILCGFEDANYFSKCFKKFVGYTPSQYRQLIKNK